MKGHAYKPTLTEVSPGKWHAHSGCECGWHGSRGGGRAEWKLHRMGDE